jgi:hypothetical protein
MSKPLKITEGAWAKIHARIAKEYPPSYLLIRETMKEKLGFCFRRHRLYQWETFTSPTEGQQRPRAQLIEECYVDFYDERKRTMFLLKYSEFLEKQNDC